MRDYLRPLIYLCAQNLASYLEYFDSDRSVFAFSVINLGHFCSFEFFAPNNIFCKIKIEPNQDKSHKVMAEDTKQKMEQVTAEAEEPSFDPAMMKKKSSKKKNVTFDDLPTEPAAENTSSAAPGNNLIQRA